MVLSGMICFRWNACSNLPICDYWKCSIYCTTLSEWCRSSTFSPAISYGCMSFRPNTLSVSAKSFQPRKNNEAGNSLNVVEREPVPPRVLNPNASGVSYKPKQRSYRNVLKPFRPNENWAETDLAETVLGRNNQEPNTVGCIRGCSEPF